MLEMLTWGLTPNTLATYYKQQLKWVCGVWENYSGGVIRAAKRLFSVPDFRLYLFADGIREVCARSSRRFKPGAQASHQLASGVGFPTRAEQRGR